MTALAINYGLSISSKYYKFIPKRKFLCYVQTRHMSESTEDDIMPESFAGDGTIKNIKETLMKSMGVDYGYEASKVDRSHLLKHLPSTQGALPKRTMKESFASAVIPLSTDLKMQHKYVFSENYVRLGRLLEDMDVFAAYIVYKYIKNPNLPRESGFPYTIVTALVDRIDFTDYVVKSTKDIRLSGHVSWVGMSSVEVTVWLQQHDETKLNKVTRALFLMACRDSVGKKAAPVNALIATNDREKALIENGESRHRVRRYQAEQLLTKVTPTPEEQAIMHELFIRTTKPTDISLHKRKLPDKSVWMKNCTLSNNLLTHPQDKNLQNTVFGGYIMRKAVELSFALGYLYTKERPVLKNISNISFKMPIEVNMLIRMQAVVVFTFGKYMQIAVHAETSDPLQGTAQSTNALYFTYQFKKNVVTVWPYTYQEAMMYIDGRRHFYGVMTPEYQFN